MAEAAKSNDAAWLKSAKNKASRKTNDAIPISNFSKIDHTYKAKTEVRCFFKGFMYLELPLLIVFIVLYCIGGN